MSKRSKANTDSLSIIWKRLFMNESKRNSTLIFKLGKTEIDRIPGTTLRTRTRPQKPTPVPAHQIAKGSILSRAVPKLYACSEFKCKAGKITNSQY